MASTYKRNTARRSHVLSPLKSSITTYQTFIMNFRLSSSITNFIKISSVGLFVLQSHHFFMTFT